MAPTGSKLVLRSAIKNVLHTLSFNIADCGTDYHIVAGRPECDYGQFTEAP